MVHLSGVIVLAFAGLAAAAASGKRSFIPPPAGVKELSEKERRALPKFQPSHKHRGVTVIPDNFDARTKWPQCASIKTIRNQGQCGTCWAVSAASVLSDRLCIAEPTKNANLFISANQAATCSQPTKSSAGACNDGGDAASAYKYASQFGIQSGGEYNSKVGCVPYPVAPDQAPPLTCAKSCTNSAFTKALKDDTYFIDGYWADYKPSGTQMTQAQIDEAVNKIQTDVLVNGPLTVSMTVYSDFQDWEATDAPYCVPKAGSANYGGHAVRLIGWVKRADGKKAWLIANSWGTEVGDQGVFQIEMGKNCVGIERTISAPQVKIPNTCTAQSFCDAVVDQAVQTVVTDAASPKYLFQGNCTLQVTTGADGKLTPVGAAAPLSAKWQGAPAGPIVSYLTQNNQLWIINNQGKAGANCVQPAGARSLACGGGSATGTPYAQAVIPGSPPQKWSYYNDDNKEWIFDTNGSGVYVKDMLTSKFSKVTAFLNVDGKKAVVFGKGTTGAATAGILNYPPAGSKTFSWAVPPGPAKGVFTKCA